MTPQSHPEFLDRGVIPDELMSSPDNLVPKTHQSGELRGILSGTHLYSSDAAIDEHLWSLLLSPSVPGCVQLVLSSGRAITGRCAEP